MLVNMKEKRNIYSLLVSLKSCTAPLEITMEIAQKLKLDILYNWVQSLLAFRHYTDLPTVNWQDVLANIQAVFWPAQGPDNVISYVVNANDFLKGGDHLLPPSLPLSWSLSLCLPVSLSLSLYFYNFLCSHMATLCSHSFSPQSLLICLGAPWKPSSPAKIPLMPYYNNSSLEYVGKTCYPTKDVLVQPCSLSFFYNS